MRHRGITAQKKNTVFGRAVPSILKNMGVNSSIVVIYVKKRYLGMPGVLINGKVSMGIF